MWLDSVTDEYTVSKNNQHIYIIVLVLALKSEGHQRSEQMLQLEARVQ